MIEMTILGRSIDIGGSMEVRVDNRSTILSKRTGSHTPPRFVTSILYYHDNFYIILNYIMDRQRAIERVEAEGATLQTLSEQFRNDKEIVKIVMKPPFPLFL
jgi:hypothetical protein